MVVSCIEHESRLIDGVSSSKDDRASYGPGLTAQHRHVF